MYPRASGHCVVHSFDYVQNIAIGDLISFNNNKLAIYDGSNYIILDRNIIPQNFSVIENNIPIDYWYDTEKNPGNPYNNYVWFNHTKSTSVLKQCLKNIQYSRVYNNLYAIFTSFVYNNNHYRIVYDHTDCSWDFINHKTLQIPLSQVDFLIEKFSNQLKGSPLLFECSSQFYSELPISSTLFVSDFSVPENYISY